MARHLNIVQDDRHIVQFLGLHCCLILVDEAERILVDDETDLDDFGEIGSEILSEENDLYMEKNQYVIFSEHFYIFEVKKGEQLSFKKGFN